jgi:hypothetical protein
VNRKKTLRKQRARRDPLALDRMFDRTVNSVFAKGVPKALYHYTNWAGAEGIISTQEFWATAHDCTNDEAELVSANDIIVEVVKSLRANATRFTLQVLNEFLRNYDRSQVSQVIPSRIAFAEILIGPNQGRNQDSEAARERLKKILEATGYKPGDMEYPEIVVSGLAAWT